jgi:hypothetical protein
MGNEIMNENYRSPSAIEWAVLKRLLEKTFTGRNDLLGQLDGLTVKTIDEEGSLSLKTDPRAAQAEARDRVVAEGYYSDEDVGTSDGPQVHVLLHVVRGRLAELEIYKDDGSPIKKPLSAENLVFY